MCACPLPCVSALLAVVMRAQVRPGWICAVEIWGTALSSTRAVQSGESGVCCLHIVLSRTWTNVEMLAIQLCLLDACNQGTYRTGQSLKQASSVHEYLVIGVVNTLGCQAQTRWEL